VYTVYDHRQRIAFKEQRYAERIRKDFGQDYVRKGMELAKDYAERIIKEVK
jgi:hypothetical protein